MGIIADTFARQLQELQQVHERSEQRTREHIAEVRRLIKDLEALDLNTDDL